MSEPDPEPNSSVLGIAFPPLPEGWTVLEVLVVTRCLNEDGEVAHAYRNSEDLTGMEALGMAHYAVEHLTRALFEDDDG